MSKESLVARILAGVKNRRRVRWPGTEEDVDLVILSSEQVSEAVFAAERRFAQAKIPVASHTLDAWEAENTVQMLWRILREPDTDEPLTVTADGFRALPVLTVETRNELVRMYRAFEEETSPNPTLMTEEEFAEFSLALKKKPDEMLPFVSSTAFAKRLLRSLVAPPPT